MPVDVPIEKFTTVDVRNVWPHEAADFTPWLAENAEYLTDALGLDLDIEATEVNVGNFRVDIKAKEVGSDTVVIIENQLEPTNHGHLGQLLTYAAGLEAGYVVWIATTIRDEHRTALRWLNQNTQEGFGFFGLEVEAVRIGDSPVAVRLNVVERPDEWAKATAERSKAPTPKDLLYQKYWSQFIPLVHEALPGFTRAQKPPRGSWISMSAGRSYLSYTASFTTPSRLRVELYVDAPSPAMQEQRWSQLVEQKQAIEAAFGAEPPHLEWEILPQSRASRIAVYRDGALEAEQQWPEFQTWMVKQLVRLRGATQAALTQVTD